MVFTKHYLAKHALSTILKCFTHFHWLSGLFGLAITSSSLCKQILHKNVHFLTSNFNNFKLNLNWKISAYNLYLLIEYKNTHKNITHICNNYKHFLKQPLNHAQEKCLIQAIFLLKNVCEYRFLKHKSQAWFLLGSSNFVAWLKQKTCLNTLVNTGPDIYMIFSR